MARYRTVNQLSPVNTAYVAGLVDGEGTITLSRKHRSDNRQLVITISSTERQLLECVLELVGAGRITTKRTAMEHHARSYTFTINNRQALALLEQIDPFLKTYKAKRSKLILRDYVALTPRNGKYRPEIRRKRTEFENLVLGLKANDADPWHLCIRFNKFRAELSREIQWSRAISPSTGCTATA